jgi:hypothetical protein
VLVKVSLNRRVAICLSNLSGEVGLGRIALVKAPPREGSGARLNQERRKVGYFFG